MREIMLKHPNADKRQIDRYLKFITKYSGTGGNVKHHILPKSNDCWPEFSDFKENAWNCALLTERQHFIAHWILWKAIGGLQTNAFYQMKHCEGMMLTSRVYESLRNSIDYDYLQLKRKQSNLNKYGVENIQQVDEIRLRSQSTMKERYGTCSPRLMGDGYENFKRTWNSEEFRQSESYYSYIESRIGGNNGRAKPIVFRNKNYKCIKDAIEDTGISRYLILKEIKGE